MDMSREVDLCDDGLALGLGVGGRSAASSTGHRRQHQVWSSMAQKQQPSLTLNLADHAHGGAALLNKVCAEEGRHQRPSSPHSHSTVSSFSAGYTPAAIKREMYYVVGGEEVEVERSASRGGSYDDNDGSARKKLRLTKEQSALLEDRFKEHSSLNPKQKHALAKQLNLRPRQVEVWFQNRRARTKLKQTEVDCEFLKRCCESLTEENRRLRKELQELKALKLIAPPPVYMQLPAATLTMCPSCCKTVGGAANGSKVAAAESFVVASPKPHFFNPFSHSTTC